MRSRYADKFNHDDAAAGYDLDVDNEEHPIRAGYSSLLDWVASRAEVQPKSSVLELGCGTGNLTERLPVCRRLLAVDVSEEMLRRAEPKLGHLGHVELRRADLLECFDGLDESFDHVVSTYAIHHLEADEKSLLFAGVKRALAPGGHALFGDLMFPNDEHRASYLQKLRAEGRSELADEIAEEFFWDLGRAERELRRLGFQVRSERFSELSFGIAARLAVEP